MIDWANLLVGAALGFILGLIPWRIDRGRSKRQRVADARIEWMSAAKQIELALKPDATAGDIYKVRVQYPVDHWRSILGPEDFVKLGRLESGFQQVEGFGERYAKDPTPENKERLRVALEQRKAAYIEFANMARRMQDVSYNEVTTAEARAKLRGDYFRHPVRTIKRERHNRRVRRETS